MWVLYGRTWRSCDDDFERVASFSSEKLANEYIEKSKLKRSTWNSKFINKSLLGFYREAWVGWEDSLAHDPDPPR